MVNNFFIQGLVGMGLVGYNVADFLQKNLESTVIRSYSEFFPSIAFLDSKAKLSTKTIEVSKANIPNGDSDSNIFIMHGSQPDEETLSYFFIKAVEKDMRIWNENNPISLYIAFGVTAKEFQIPSSLSGTKTTSKAFLQEEKAKHRRIYIAFAGKGAEKHPFIKKTKKEYLLEPMGEGRYITGLNGVLPAYIGEKTGLPVVTAMIEASIPSFDLENPLSQFIGLSASRYGIKWLKSFLKFGDRPLNLIDSRLEKLEPLAISQLDQHLKLGGDPSKERGTDQKMYV
ncbi:MAG: PAC2 family protein [Candidatus Hodarchaeota archaeon]